MKYPLTKNGFVSRETFISNYKALKFDTIEEMKFNKKTRKMEATKYINAPAAFDIETTSTYTEDGEKMAFMYIWMFDFCGMCVYGRTWDEFMAFMDEIQKSSPARLVIYVHNLAYEFQFIRKLFTWDEVFALDEREPVRALMSGGNVEFRCSLILTGKKLAKLAEDVKIITIEKMVGDLDYKKVRTSRTPMAPAELGYCENDVRIVTAYIQQQIEKEGGITNIPLTKTGYVRRDVRRRCLYYENGRKNKKYYEMIHSLTIEPEEYLILKRAFEGGFTHANGFYFDRTLQDVASYDFTSSYPAVMVCRCGFPMSKGRRIAPPKSAAEYDDITAKYCAVFEIFIRGLDAMDIEGRPVYEHRLSSSRCSFWKEGPAGLERISKYEAGILEDNGRVATVPKNIIVSFTTTEVDFKVIRAVYDLGPVSFGEFWIYERGYLPLELVKAVLFYYQKKTTLKGVEGSEGEYKIFKEFVNSIYGMIVTDILRDVIEYIGDDWSSSPPPSDAIEEYNKSKQRFLFYPWGVYVTAWARYNLWTGIISIGKDYIYSDTDSVKILNHEKHEKYFTSYNEGIKAEMEAAMKHHNLPLDAWRPKNIKEKEKPLGYWDYEGIYEEFKTLGAKRYIYRQGGQLHITIAGVSKKEGAEYLEKTGDPFEAFGPGLVFPGTETGKLIHTYIDSKTEAVITDYTGHTEKVKALSSVHLSPAAYRLGIAGEYMEFVKILRGVKMTRNRGEE